MFERFKKLDVSRMSWEKIDALFLFHSDAHSERKLAMEVLSDTHRDFAISVTMATPAQYRDALVESFMGLKAVATR